MIQCNKRDILQQPLPPKKKDERMRERGEMRFDKILTI